jgi:REP-associated tyrosine transposase
MIRASHIIFTAYGFWLPNDPRGSWSDYVRAYELYRAGPATGITSRRSVAGRPHDRGARTYAKRKLAFPPVVMNGRQARAVARGFAGQAATSGYRILACAILPDHVHLVVARHRYHAEQVMNLLKGAATRQLVDEGLHPLAGYRDAKCRVPSPWAVGGWKVFLDSDSATRRAIRYVQRNPIKAGFKSQAWSFVLPVG